MTRWRWLLVLLAVALGVAFAARWISGGADREDVPRACLGPDGVDPACRFQFELARKYGARVYSQGNEELLIRDFFQDRRGGFFLDVGASDWKDDSTTALLEERLGWSGIAVDANPEFREGYVQHRPRTRYFTFFVSDKADEKADFYIVDAATKESTGVRERMDLYRQAFGDGVYRKVEVQTTTVNALLDHEKVTKVDFLSLDIEGYEPMALAGFDIDRFRPDLACVEVKGATEDAIDGFFAAHGYVEIRKYRLLDAANRYYAPKGAVPAATE
jgi:FkbM family methyltransferase